VSFESTAPDSTSEMNTLSPPAPVKPVEKEFAAEMAKLDLATRNKLDLQVDSFLKTILSTNLHSEEFKEKIAGIHSLGSDEIRASADIFNRLLNKPVRAMRDGLFDEKSVVSRGLTNLRAIVENLDPARQGDLLARKKLFGLIPFGNKLRGYFSKYQSAQSNINEIILSLYEGKENLQKDNAVIEEEKFNTWNLMQTMEQYIYVGKKLDAALQAIVAEIEATDQEKASVVKEEILFYTRQQLQDLLTQLAVTAQGYLAMDMIRKNNLELIKGIDRAATTTLSALRTAIMVAQALTHQKLVLKQISTLNSTAAHMLNSAGYSIKNQAVDIEHQTSSAAVELDKLKKAFLNIYETMDMMANYKETALDNIKQTVDLLSGEMAKAREQIGSVRDGKVEEVQATS